METMREILKIKTSSSSLKFKRCWLVFWTKYRIGTILYLLLTIYLSRHNPTNHSGGVVFGKSADGSPNGPFIYITNTIRFRHCPATRSSDTCYIITCTGQSNI